MKSLAFFSSYEIGLSSKFSLSSLEVSAVTSLFDAFMTMLAPLGADGLRALLNPYYILFADLRRTPLDPAPAAMAPELF